MHNFLATSSLAGLLAFGLGVSACDTSEPDSPTDRNAMFLLQVDGEIVEENDISDAVVVQTDFIELAESTPARVCGDGIAAIDLVLEIDGEEAASVHSCMDSAAPMPGADAIGAEPDVQGSFWTQFCEETGDCFACCRCDGFGAVYCSIACGG